MGRVLAALSVLLLPAVAAAQTARFQPVAVFIDSGSQPLASYQIEITVDGAKIVGVEGGDHPAFQRAPYYDPAALQGGRIKLAALSTASDLPRGRTRVATLHLMSSGNTPPEMNSSLTLATDADAHSIEVEIELVSQSNGGRE